jgi:transcriptional regulator with XRE-family HTH domain
MNDNVAMQDRNSDGSSTVAIGLRLKLSRTALGLGQGEFADRLDIARNTYNQYEKGVNKPPVESALKMRELFGLSLDWIYAGDPTFLRWELAEKIRQLRPTI